MDVGAEMICGQAITGDPNHQIRGLLLRKRKPLEVLRELLKLPRKVRVNFVKRNNALFGITQGRTNHYASYWGWTLLRNRKIGSDKFYDALLSLYYFSVLQSNPFSWRSRSEYKIVIAMARRNNRLIPLLLKEVELFRSRHVMDVLEEVVKDGSLPDETQDSDNDHPHEEQGIERGIENAIEDSKKKHKERVNAWLAWGKERGLL